jgi:hypothetical protein
MEDLKNLSKDELNELVVKNAEQLSATKGPRVEGLLLNTNGFDSSEGEWVIGYYTAPTLYQKMTMLDNIEKDKMIKGMQILEKNLIRENSDPRFLEKENPDNHKLIIGASLAVVGKSIDFSVNQVTELKKNGE